ncbi:MAG: prolyl oligopeptidase family serine peptidase [Candidatus Asgardarchaeia archaeon]
MTEGLKIDDLSKLVLVSDPRISPDGNTALFTVTNIDLENDKYISKIWIADLDAKEYESVTNGPNDYSPRWSPDGKRIAFLSRRTLKEDERGSELWIMRIDGKYEPRMLLKLKGGINNIQWSPDGKKILFISAVGQPEEDVKVVERIPIWFNELGFVYNLFSHLFVVDVETGNYQQLSKGNINVQSARWSPDGKKIAYLVKEYELKPHITNIYVYEFDKDESFKLTDDKFNMHDLTWSPGGQFIAFRGHNFPRGLASHEKVWLLALSDKSVKLLTDINRDLDNSMNSDVRGAGSGTEIQWIGKHIYFPVADGGEVHLYRVDTDGNIEPMIKGNFVVESYSVGNERIALTLMSSTALPELYVFDYKDLTKVTSFNAGLLNKLSLQKPEHFKFKASDGKDVDGWILKPVNFEAGKKYPAILEIHGGPATAYGEGFMHEFHVLSNEGYVVIFTNPRGSTGYSEEFRDIRGKYGERDFQDLMEAIDYALKHYDFIDKDRLGVTGGSYGGFMTNWIISHTDKFKAAVTQRSISNFASFYGTTDIGFVFGPDQIAGDFDRHAWDEEWFSKYWDQSPLKYIKNAKTPLLIIHSIDDYRCWLDQALQIFTALKVKGIDTRLVLFPKENHNLSRKGKPKHRKKRLEEMVNWFNKYLKEKKN